MANHEDIGLFHDIYFTLSKEFSSRDLQIVLLFQRIFSAIVRPFLINITDPT